ncbi:MAG: hypothetical protein LBH43_02410 [Treponema sp.]|nr:hypothetical protein [Treponema sp.]
MRYIWFWIIRIRTFIVDFHKYDMEKVFDKAGNWPPQGSQEEDRLQEFDYAAKRGRQR